MRPLFRSKFLRPDSSIQKTLLGGFAALMLKCVLRFWTPRYRANPRPFAVWPRLRTFDGVQFGATPEKQRRYFAATSAAPRYPPAYRNRANRGQQAMRKMAQGD